MLSGNVLLLFPAVSKHFKVSSNVHNTEVFSWVLVGMSIAEIVFFFTIKQKQQRADSLILELSLNKRQKTAPRCIGAAHTHTHKHTHTHCGEEIFFLKSSRRNAIRTMAQLTHWRNGTQPPEVAHMRSKEKTAFQSFPFCQQTFL